MFYLILFLTDEDEDTNIDRKFLLVQCNFAYVVRVETFEQCMVIL